MDKVFNISCIGAGNVAGHLLPALFEAGHNIEQVISRSVGPGESLAKKVNAVFSKDVSDLNPGIEILFLTVPDHVLPDMISKLSGFKGIVTHTSGSVPLNCFSRVHYPNGVLYPLQTFSSSREIDFNNIPIFIEGSDTRVLSVLSEISNQISSKVSELNSEQRAYLHLAAVFANNFPNHLITIAKDILQERGLEPALVNDLIRETFEKAIDTGATGTQTGPAVRGDIPTIKKHLKLLSFSTEFQSVYQYLTRSIQEYYKTELRKK